MRQIILQMTYYKILFFQYYFYTINCISVDRVGRACSRVIYSMFYNYEYLISYRLIYKLGLGLLGLVKNHFILFAFLGSYTDLGIPKKI